MKDTFDFMALGQAIKKAREAKGMTREQLAEILGVCLLYTSPSPRDRG